MMCEEHYNFILLAEAITAFNALNSLWWRVYAFGMLFPLRATPDRCYNVSIAFLKWRHDLCLF